MLCFAETKIDSSFPSGQFSFEGYHSPYRLYRLDLINRRRGLLVYVNVSIPTRQLKYKIKRKNIQIILFKINLRKKNGLWYRPPQKSEYFVNVFTDIIDYSSRVYDNRLKVQSHKLYNSNYMIASTQITNTEIFAFIAVPVFKLLSRKVLFINIKDNRNC